MARLFIKTENMPRSLEPNPASADLMSPEVVALISASVLIFLVFLSSSIVLIRRRRLRHRTQDITQVEAQVHLPRPIASKSEEKVENVSQSPSGSSKSCAVLPLLPTTSAPRSATTASAEKPIEKLMAKTSAALSKVDKYTTLPLRRARQARQAKNAQKNLVFDFSTPLAALDAQIANSENSAPSRHASHQFSSMRSTSLTSGPSTSAGNASLAPPSSELLPCSIDPSTSSHTGPPTLRPSPTVVSMEIRPLEVDAAALPETGTMLVSGSFPSLSSCSSDMSLSSVCNSGDDGHRMSEADASKHSYATLDCETPRGKEHRTLTEKGTPPSSMASLSTMTTGHDSSFSSDADTVCEVGLGKTSLAVKAVKLDNRLSFPISVSNLSLDLQRQGRGCLRHTPQLGPRRSHQLDEVLQRHEPDRGRQSHDSRIGRHLLLACPALLLDGPMTASD